MVSEPVSEKFGTENSLGISIEKNLVPKKSLGIGLGKIWYRKKVSEPVLEKFGTGTNFRRQNLEILKIYNEYWYRYREFVIFSGGIGTGIGKIWYQKESWNQSRKKFGTEKGPGTGLGKFWYRKKSQSRSRKNLVPKKVPEPVSENFGTEKKSRNRYRSDFGSRHTLVSRLVIVFKPLKNTGSSKQLGSFIRRKYRGVPFLQFVM